MKTVKKFETFEDLKSDEKNPSEYTSSLKKHSDFEKVIKEIRSVKLQNEGQNKSGQ